MFIMLMLDSRWIGQEFTFWGSALVFFGLYLGLWVYGKLRGRILPATSVVLLRKHVEIYDSISL